MNGARLTSEIIKRWFNRRRPVSPRSVRIVVRVNDKTLLDIDSKLALAMIDCQYGKPVVVATGGETEVVLTITEGGPK